MLKKILFAVILLASFSAHSQQFQNVIASTNLPANEGLILDVVDYNNDGYEDVVYQNTLTGNLELYRNLNGVFSNVSSFVGLPAIPGSGNGNEGVTSFDFNNDGFQDLLIASSGPSGYIRLFQNNCGASFTEVTSTVNLPTSPNIVAQYLTNDPIILVADYDKDKDNDIIFCRNSGGEFFISALKNNGGTFASPANLLTSLGATTIPYIALFDFDNDRDEDLLVIKNTSINAACQIDLYENGAGIYSLISTTGLINSSPVGFANIIDYNNDGYLDILLGTKAIILPGSGNQGLKVFRNNAGTTSFTDVTLAYNTLPTTIGDYFNSHVFDLDNDGDNDVLWEINQSTTTSVPALMRNNGVGSNVFSDQTGNRISVALTSSNKFSKYFIFDYDKDGALDIFMPGTAGAGTNNAQLFKNSIINNNYLNIKLLSCSGQADPIGARIYVKAGTNGVYKNYNAQGSSTTASGKSEITHFGLGNNSIADSIIIYWPSGAIDVQTGVASNQNLTIVDGACSIGDPLTFDLGPDTTTVCSQDTGYLLAPGGFKDYSWNTGDITPDIKVTTKGWYKCTVTNINDCSTNDSIYVAFGDGDIVQNDTTLCLGNTIVLEASPRYDCSPFGAPVKRKVSAGQDLGPTVTYVNSFNGHHYYIFNSSSTWSKAEGDAVKLGGHLAVVNSKEENDFITTQLPIISDKNLWIGLYKSNGINSPYKWVNCEKIEYTKWMSGSPFTGSTANNVYLRGMKCTNGGRWKNTDENLTNTDTCESNFFGLVEFDEATNISYLWQNGDTTVTTSLKAVLPSPMVFNVLVTQNGANCFATININVVDPNNLITEDTMTECKASFMMVQALEGMKSYTWSTGSKNSFIFVSTSGSNRWYKLTAETPEGCIGVDSVFVSLSNNSIRTPDTTVCLGTQVFLRGPTPPFTYREDYTQNFQSAPFFNWNSLSAINFNGSKVLGPFGNDSVTYNIIDLPTHDSISVTFDLYIHDTWDGNCSPEGPDRFRFKNGAANIMNTTFSNEAGCTQEYTTSGAPGAYPAKTGAAITGLVRRCDINGGTTKYTISKAFRHSTANLDLAWVGDLKNTGDNSALCLESWTLDNVKVSVRRAGNVLWSTGDTTQNIFVKPVDPVTEYWVQIPVGNTFCYDTVLVSTTTGKLSNDIYGADTLRVCSATGTATNLSLPANFDLYNWSTGDMTRATKIYNEGWYTGYVATLTGCYNFDSIYVTKNGFEIVPNYDTTVCYGEPFTIKANLKNNCNPFGAPANTGYVAAQVIPGYTYKGEYRGSHYYLADVNSTWGKAAQNALAAGGHLVSILDTNEQKFIEQIVDSNVWIGAYNGPNGYFIWMNCDTITYSNWATSEPGATPNDYVFMRSASCAEPKKWDSNTDSDQGNPDLCLNNIYGLLEIQPYQYVFDWRLDFTPTFTTDSFVFAPTAITRVSGLITESPGAPNCGVGSINISIIDEGFRIIPDSITKISCEGDTAMVEALPGYSNYSWDNGDTTRIAVYSGLIGYAYCTYDNGTCKFVDSVYLNVPGKLKTTPIVTDITCLGSNDGIANTGVSEGTPTYKILWLHNNSTNFIETGLSPGIYYYTVIDSNNCNTIDSVDVTNPPSLLTLDFLKLSNVKCYGDSNARVLPLPSGGEAPYKGIWVGYPYTDTLFFGKAGIYTYAVTDVRGCTVSKNDTILEPVKLDITANILTQIFCPEDSTGVAVLIGSGGTGNLNYVWNFASIIGDTVFKITEGTYLAYVYDQNFCYDSVAVVMTASNPDKCGVIVPSGFTPNGDGKNDNFYIRGLGDFSENELTIFNRWGETVYQATNYQNDWNGKPNKSTLLSGNDGIVPNDTYYYILYTKANNKTVNGYVYITK